MTLLSSVAAAQPPRAYFWWNVMVHGARNVVDAPRPTFALSVPQPAIEMVWTFKNEVGDDVVTVVPAALESAIEIRVKGDDGMIETAPSWAADGKLIHQSEPAVVSPQQPIVLHPGDLIEWRLSLGRKDGAAWALGRYEYAIDMTRAFAALRKDDLPWAVRGSREGRITVTIDDGTSKEARRFGHQWRASEALANGRPLDAVEEYRQMIAEDPADEGGYAGLGVALVRARRFKDAIEPLERALPFALKQDSTLPDILAYAYLGIGDELNALRVLRLALPESLIPARLEKFKASLAAGR